MAAWFSDKLVSQITEADLQDLIEQQATEDQCLEFKAEPHAHPGEMLKDICALANADGGYLVIGVAQGTGNTAAAFQGVTDAARTAENMMKSCTQSITPRIEGLEILPKLAPGGVEIIIARVPVSASRPHVCTRNNQTQFWRRYSTENREMSHEEIRATFLRDRVLLSLVELHSKVDELLRGQVKEKIPAIRPSDDALAKTSSEELRQLMDLRFAEMSGDKPYFRMSAVPVLVAPTSINVNDPQIRGLFEKPPRTHDAGWVIYSRPARMTEEGLESSLDPEDQRLVLLSNGYLEFSLPARSEFFQWKQSEEEAQKHPWLYPYAVCELPVNFVRWAKAVYEVAQFQGMVAFWMGCYGIRGFVLRPYDPESRGFLMSWPETATPFERRDFKGAPVSVSVPFDPDTVAFQLVGQLYNAFGLTREHIPCFDPQGRFTLRG